MSSITVFCRKKPPCLRLLVVVLIGMLPVSLFARDVKITVRDADLGFPLEGAHIRSPDGVEYTAGTDGTVILTVPDDTPIVITLAYPGYTNLRLPLPPGSDTITAELHLSGSLENRELVIEAEGSGHTPVESHAGRAVAIGGEDLSRTAETGLVEDVMTAIQLLPGVGYTGFFDAMPSIRGGEPRDLTAVLDGFYIENPYHWGGGFSIFDPRMIEQARLSHGVFSSRYGSTISGLLELESKRPSPDAFALSGSLSTNAADLNLSFPLRGKGGILLMGKVTWWQPFIELAHLFIPISRNVKQAPWIGSGALSANYRFTPGLELIASGYFGADGIGFSYGNEGDTESTDLITIEDPASSMSHFFKNHIGFFNAALVMNPRNTMVIKTSLGAGLSGTDVTIDMHDTLTVRYTEDFRAGHPEVPETYEIDEYEYHHRSDRTTHAQTRTDFDWDLGRGFLFAAGVHEQYSIWSFNQEDHEPYLLPLSAGSGVDYASAHRDFAPELRNQGLATSGYTLLEYRTPGARFGAELGLALDHLYIIGEDFTRSAKPVFNPRLNLDFNLWKPSFPGLLESLNLTLGTGLFSSADEILHYLEKRHVDSAEFELKPSRSWTNLAGLSMGFPGAIQLSVEGYYKQLFDRTYSFLEMNSGNAAMVYKNDGEGRIWGIDVLLQKTGGRYWDGWITYSFNNARYHDPLAPVADRTIIGSEAVGSEWYYPGFHRFHTVNLVLNIKPTRKFSIAARLGFTSGKPAKQLGNVQPVLVQTEDGNLIVQFMRSESPSNGARTAFSLPLDLKFSWYLVKPARKVSTEIYFGVENTLAMILPSARTTMVNRYTGAVEEAGGMAVMTQLAMPIPSFGVKWSY